MDRPAAARMILTLDAAGCLGSAGAVAVSDAVLRLVDPTLRSRWPLAAALSLTAAVLASGAARARPSRGSLNGAALINAGWVGFCLATSRGRPAALGTALVLTTAALDAAMAAAQLAARPGR